MTDEEDENEVDPFEELAAESGDLPEDPFAELAADLETDTEEHGGFETGEEGPAFEEADFDSLWADLEGQSPGEGTVEVEEEGDVSIDVVPKRNFCERCQYFSDPPEVHCTHEGTEIVEFVDNQTVRLKNCPIVARRRDPESLE